MSVSGWEATEVALVVAAVLAPGALVLLVAMLRGYSVKVWRGRAGRERPDEGGT